MGIFSRRRNDSVKQRKVTTAKQALQFVREHGIVLVSGKGPAPRLSEAIVGLPIKGRWWAHPRSHQMFRIFRELSDSPEIIVCRLVNDKLTFVHRRLWPALVRAARHFSARQLERAGQEHTTSGYHVARTVPFPKWVPLQVTEEAKLLTEEEALHTLGAAFHRARIDSELRVAKRRSQPWPTQRIG
jgi:hypothetical protein